MRQIYWVDKINLKILTYMQGLGKSLYFLLITSFYGFQVDFPSFCIESFSSKKYANFFAKLVYLNLVHQLFFVK